MENKHIVIGPFKVVIDTEVFIRSNFNYAGDLAIFREYVDDGVISSIIVSDITLREVKRNLSERCYSLTNDLIKISESRDWKIIGGLPSFSETFQNINAEKMVNDAYGLFEDYLKSIKAEILNSDGVRLEKILEDYFSSNPPFGKKDKKSEFPDAIIIEKVKSILDYQEKTFIISNDNDWGKAFSGANGVIVCKSLKDLFNHFTSGFEISKKVYEDYLVHQNEINEFISLKMESLNYVIDGYEYDRKGIVCGVEYDEWELNKIDVKSKFECVDYIDQTTVKATIKIKSNLEFVCLFLNEENVIWDSEDKEYIHTEQCTNKEIHLLERFVTLVYNIKVNEIVDFDYSPYFNGTLELNHYTLVNRIPINSADDFNDDFSVKRIYNCPICGKENKVDLLEDAQTISQNNRNMGIEVEYAINIDGICQCGKKYCIEGEIYEYPIGALNYDTTKITWE